MGRNRGEEFGEGKEEHLLQAVSSSQTTCWHVGVMTSLMPGSQTKFWLCSRARAQPSRADDTSEEMRITSAGGAQSLIPGARGTLGRKSVV